MAGYVEQARNERTKKLIPGRWWVRYALWEVDAAGKKKRRQKKETITGTKAQAEARLTAIQHAQNVGTYIEPTELTLADWLTSWLRDYVKPPNASHRTHETVRALIRDHIIPGIGDVKLHKLSAGDLQRFLVSLLVKPCSIHGKPLAFASVRRIRSVLSGALKQAIHDKKLLTDPCVGVKITNPGKTQKAQDMTVLTERQLSELLRRSKGTNIEIEVLIAATTGMRLGEVLGLRWDDLDWEKRTIRIDEALEVSQDYGRSLKAPKSTASRRVIDLPPSVVEPLRRHQIEQMKLRTEKGGAWNEAGLVCPWKRRLRGRKGSAANDGGLQSVSRVSHDFSNFMAAKCPDLPQITYHGLRHTFASLMIHQGASYTEVSRMLGHASPVVTLDIYSHAIPGASSEAVARFDETLRMAGGL